MECKKSKIILGSGSANRKKILKELGYTFEIMKAGIDEKLIRHDDYYQLPLLIARSKATALISKITKPALLITADQVVVWKGELREKPTNSDEIRCFLKSYSGSEFPAECVNGIVVTDTKTGKVKEGIEISKVYFFEIPDEIIEKVAEEKQALKWAGGFTPEYVLLAPYISKIEGTKEGLMGLPIKMLEQLLAEI